MLAREFQSNPDSVFAIAGPQEGDDNSQVWVTMGGEEEQLVSTLNFVQERGGNGTAFQLTEGETTFKAIVDTGCTEHLTSNKEILINLQKLTKTRIFKCANNDDNANLSVNYKGDLCFINNGQLSTLNDVLYTPGLSTNLFSVRKVTQLGLDVVFTHNIVKFIQKSTNTVIKTGYFKNNLWWIEFTLATPSTKRAGILHAPIESKRPRPDLASHGQPCSSTASQISRSSFEFKGGRVQASNPSGLATVGGRSSYSSVPAVFSASLGGRNHEKLDSGKCNTLTKQNHSKPQLDRPENIDLIDLKIAKFDKESLEKLYTSLQNSDILWHIRLNHVSKNYLEAAKKFLPELKNVKVTDSILNCEDCHQANTLRKSHTQVRHRAEKPFAVLYSDLLGAISPVNFRTGASYIVIFVCGYSRYLFAYTLKNKKEVHLALEKCLREIASITSQIKNVFKLRSDRGLEFQTLDMKQLLSREGIIWDPCQPHTPQQNGCAERVNQELKHKIRVNLLSAKMPYSFWGHALNYVVFVYNRMPHSSNNFKSPFELVKGFAPSIKHVKRFGCLVHYVDVSNKSKFAPNAKKGFLLECNDTGYVIFSEQHKTLVNSSDVKCIETIVYGDRIKDYPRPLAEILDLDGELEYSELVPESSTSLESQPGNSNSTSLQNENSELQATVNQIVNHEYTEPSSYREAMSAPDRDLWEEAIRSELESPEEMGTWELKHRSELPQGVKVIKSRWVHKRKVEADGSLKYKSRLVIKGFADTNDYLVSEIYAPVARLSDVRVFLSVANKLGLYLHQLDVTTAFLHGTLEKPVYMHIPDGLVELADRPLDLKGEYVCLLKRSLYGLKVSPNLWYNKFSKILTKLGFEVYPFQTCIFKWSQGNIYLLLIIYVDDCILASNDNDKAFEIIQALQMEIKIKNLGVPKKFLGFQIVRDESRKQLFIHQRVMIQGLLDKYLSPEEDTSDIPMLPTTCTMGAQQDSDLTTSPDVPYREVIGALLYIQNSTRPDIAFAVNYLSRKQISFTWDDWKCVLKILKYLKGTLNLGIMFSGRDEGLVAYSDASLGTNAPNGRSTTGYVVAVFGDMVSWRSKKQTHVALSTCESEYLAMSETCKEVISIRTLCGFLAGVDMLPTLRCDCAPAIAVAMTNDSKTLKHVVKLSLHFVHDLFKDGKIRIEWVSTHEQIADCFTKALSKIKFLEFRNAIMFDSNALF